MNDESDRQREPQPGEYGHPDAEADVAKMELDWLGEFLSGDAPISQDDADDQSADEKG